MSNSWFSEKLLSWYPQYKRELPWRNTKDPYTIWLSEVILQQTRVKQGLPYFEKFIEAYPTVVELAKANEQEVLRLWQGLGYYSRARNMHKTANIITNELRGKFPDTYRSLLKLKGVGKYTAAAIASFAYNEPVAVVDGNVYRVLARVFGLNDDIASTKGQTLFFEKAQELIPQMEAGEYNQAIMEFGAIQCTPKNPNCMFCPLQTACEANRLGIQTELPVKTKKTKVRNRFFHYLVMERKEKLFMVKRTEKGIWQGLHDFVNLEATQSKNEGAVFKQTQELLQQNNFVIDEISREYVHVLSHQKLHVRFYHIVVKRNVPKAMLKKGKWYALSEVEELPKPILIQKYLQEKFTGISNNS